MKRNLRQLEKQRRKAAHRAAVLVRELMAVYRRKWAYTKAIEDAHQEKRG